MWRRLLALAQSPVALQGALLLLLAGALRLWDLGGPSLNVDEVFSLEMARMPVEQLLDQIRGDNHPPLFYLLLSIWRSLGESEAVLRLAAVLPGLALVALAWGWGARFDRPQTGFWAAFFTALSSWLICRDREARSYSLLALGVWLSLAFFWEACRGRRRWPWALYGAFCLASLYTHYNALLMLAVPWATLAVCPRLRQSWKALALVQGLVLAGFAPWLPVFAHQLVHGGGSSLQATSVFGRAFGAHIGDLAWFLTAGAQTGLSAGFRLPLLAAAALLATVGWGSLGDRALGRFLLLSLAVPIVEAGLAQGLAGLATLTGKHGHFLFLPYYLLLGAGTAALARKQSLWAVGAVSLWAGLNLYSWTVFIADPLYQNPPWRQIARDIEARARPQDAVIVYLPYHARAYHHYARAGLPLYAIDIGQLPRATWGLKRFHARVWLVLIHEQLEDPQDLLRRTFDQAFAREGMWVYPNVASFDRVRVYLYRTGSGG